MGTLIIGLGNRARMGKDYCANYMHSLIPDKSVILHFADKVKEELSNKERKKPLIIKEKNYFKILDNDNYLTFEENEVPLLKQIFEKRNITEYMGMDEKDRDMLQFWGTDFRRNLINKNYWVNIIDEQVKQHKNKIILIPDTRFLNEYHYIKFNDGIYIKVLKVNENNEIIYADINFVNHQSEKELDDIKADYTIKAKEGDLEELQAACFVILKKLGAIN